jgi:hypothetical protein
MAPAATRLYLLSPTQPRRNAMTRLPLVLVILVTSDRQAGAQQVDPIVHEGVGGAVR